MFQKGRYFVSSKGREWNQSESLIWCIRQAVSASHAVRNCRHELNRPAERPGGVIFFCNRCAFSALATMPPVMADGHHGTQIESGYGGNGIEPGLAFDAKRLKSERVVEPADETVSRDADTYRRPTGSTDISARQRTQANPRSGRED